MLDANMYGTGSINKHKPYNENNEGFSNILKTLI